MDGWIWVTFLAPWEVVKQSDRVDDVAILEERGHSSPSRADEEHPRHLRRIIKKKYNQKEGRKEKQKTTKGNMTIILFVLFFFFSFSFL